MKSIADGGLCHQFHYAGVVTKIISMIDEMATCRHAEIMPGAWTAQHNTKQTKRNLNGSLTQFGTFKILLTQGFNAAPFRVPHPPHIS